MGVYLCSISNGRYDRTCALGNAANIRDLSHIKSNFYSCCNLQNIHVV